MKSGTLSDLPIKNVSQSGTCSYCGVSFLPVIFDTREKIAAICLDCAGIITSSFLYYYRKKEENKIINNKPNNI